MKQYGHINFDMIHISTLLSQGYDVSVIAHKEIADKMPLNMDKYAFILPKWLGNECKNSLNRLFYLFTLLYIKIRIAFVHYDYCIISNIDELTLGLLPITSNMYMICHGSCRGFESKIKRFFLERLSKKNTFIVFNEEMTIPFKEHGISKVKIIQHGCIAPFKEIQDTTLPTYIEGYKHIVFHASPKTDHSFIKEVYNEKYNDVLKESNTLLLLRNNPFPEKELSNIKFINHHLSKDDYQTIFLRSEIILFAYPKSFYLQVSGVSFECVANKKKILALQHSSLDYYKSFCNYDPFFKSAEEMMKKINMLYNNLDLNITITPEELTPDYSKIFNT